MAAVTAVVLALTVVAGVLNYGGFEPVSVFVVSGIALGGLAWVVAVATEAVGTRFGPADGVSGFSRGDRPSDCRS